jgi:pimeloyl-ACP methyl ester carboxylesterase
MDRVTVGEVELCYDLVGRQRDPVVVLVNGIASSLVAWDDALVQRFVGEGFAVLRFDNRDSGQSTILDDSPPFDLGAAYRGDRSVVTYTLDDMADDTAGLLAALGLGAGHLVGVSLGGMIAQAMAVRHPESVLSLCSIMSTTGAKDVGLPTPEAGPVLVRPPAAGRQGFVEQELENYRVIGSSDPHCVDEAWRRARLERIYDHGVHPRGSGRNLMAVAASGDRTASLAAISVPTLVVHGDADPLITRSGGEATARAIPGARLLVVPGLGHEVPPGVWTELVAAIVANARAGDELAAARPGARQ